MTLISTLSTVGTRVLENMTNNADIKDYLPPQHPPIFDLKEVSNATIAEAINRLSSSASCGFDDITSYIVKVGKTELLPLLSFIFNQSISQKTFPSGWTSAKITPLFKEGDSNLATNYRLIAILPTLGKLLERVVHDQLDSYLKDHDLLTQSQSGFRKGRSMGTCLIGFLHGIYEEIDGRGRVPVGYSSLT